jgi:hypothetical protein
MATIRATLAQPLEEASSATRRAAAARGYALAEGESTPYVLVFKKGVALFSWGSQLTVTFEVCAPSETRLRARRQGGSWIARRVGCGSLAEAGPVVG